MPNPHCKCPFRDSFASHVSSADFFSLFKAVFISHVLTCLIFQVLLLLKVSIDCQNESSVSPPKDVKYKKRNTHAAYICVYLMLCTQVLKA